MKAPIAPIWSQGTAPGPTRRPAAGHTFLAQAEDERLMPALIAGRRSPSLTHPAGVAPEPPRLDAPWAIPYHQAVSWGDSSIAQW